MQPAGLHGNQFTLLIPPYLKPDMTISELAEYAGLDRTTLARNLKLLAARRLISVGPGKDQRTRLVRLTAAGRRAVQHALPLWERAQHQVEESLGRAQLTALHAHLDTLEHALPMPCSD
jgi:DNA-binding MarR family transcriptional regulator